MCRCTMKFISFEIPYEKSLVGWAALCALFYALIYAKLAKLLVQFSTFTVVARLLRCPLTPNSNFEPLQRTDKFFIPTPHVGRPRVFGYMSSVHLFIISLLEWKLNALHCIYDKSFEIRCAQESSDFLLFKSLCVFFSLCCFVFLALEAIKTILIFSNSSALLVFLMQSLFSHTKRTPSVISLDIGVEGAEQPRRRSRSQLCV